MVRKSGDNKEYGKRVKVIEKKGTKIIWKESKARENKNMVFEGKEWFEWRVRNLWNSKCN